MILWSLNEVSDVQAKIDIVDRNACCKVVGSQAYLTFITDNAVYDGCIYLHMKTESVWCLRHC